MTQLQVSLPPLLLKLKSSYQTTLLYQGDQVPTPQVVGFGFLPGHGIIQTSQSHGHPTHVILQNLPPTDPGFPLCFGAQCLALGDTQCSLRPGSEYTPSICQP